MTTSAFCVLRRQNLQSVLDVPLVRLAYGLQFFLALHQNPKAVVGWWDKSVQNMGKWCVKLVQNVSTIVTESTGRGQTALLALKLHKRFAQRVHTLYHRLATERKHFFWLGGDAKQNVCPVSTSTKTTTNFKNFRYTLVTPRGVVEI